MNIKYNAYIGSHENIIGCYVYVKSSHNYLGGKVVEFNYPKHGIIGKYKVKCDNGKVRSTTTIYIKEVYI